MPPRSARTVAGGKHAPRAERKTASTAQESGTSTPTSAPADNDPLEAAYDQQESSSGVPDPTAPETATFNPPSRANEPAKPLKFQPKSAYTRRSLLEREARERADQGRAASTTTPHKTDDSRTESQRGKGRPLARNTSQAIAESSARTQRPLQTAARQSTQAGTGPTKFQSRESRGGELAATGILGGSAEKSHRRKGRAQNSEEDGNSKTTVDETAKSAEQQGDDDDDERPVAAGSRQARKRKVPDSTGPDTKAQGSLAGGKQDANETASRVIRKAKGKAAARDEGSKLKSEAGKADAASPTAASQWKEEAVDEKPVWDDTDEQYSRINIEQINLVSSDDEDDSEASFIDDGEPRRIADTATQAPARQSAPSTSAFRPVRLERQEHTSRAVGINTEASSSTSAELRKRATGRRGDDGSLEVPDEDAVEVVSSRAVGKRRARVTDQAEGSGSAIKQEPDDTRMELDDDVQDTSKTVSRRPGLRQLEEAEPSSTHLPRRRGYLNPLPPGTVVDDANDPEMRAIFDAWKEVMAAEAADDSTASTTNPSRTNASDFRPGPDLEGKLFLLQLPPIMPRLTPRSADPNSDTNARENVKTETFIDAQESNAMDAVPEPPATNDLSGPADSTVEAITPSSSNKDIFTATDDQFPSGRAGSVTVYESGKIVADWGGVAFELQPAPTAGLLQQVLTYEQSTAVTKVEGMAETEQWEETTQLGKEAWDLGPIQGGLIATPDLEALLRD